MKRRLVDLRDEEIFIGAVGARGIERLGAFAECGIQNVLFRIRRRIGIVPGGVADGGRHQRGHEQQPGRGASDCDELAGHVHHSAREFSTDDWIRIKVAQLYQRPVPEAKFFQ